MARERHITRTHARGRKRNLIMATLQEIGNAIGKNNGVLFTRLVGAVVTAAGAIRIESPSTPNHDNRLKWADLVSVRPTEIAQAFFNRLLQDSNVQNAITDPGSVTDVQIQNAVDGVVDEFATGA